jgi:hypothetical protein
MEAGDFQGRIIVMAKKVYGKVPAQPKPKPPKKPKPGQVDYPVTPNIKDRNKRTKKLLDELGD